MAGQITLRDVAERAGVSKVAASVALRGNRGTVFVSEETRRRIRTIADELGYRPNGAARALATGRTYTVEFWAQNVNNPFFNAVFHAVRRHLLAHDLAVMLFEAWAPSPTLVSTPLPVDGLLIFDCPGNPERLRHMMAARGIAARPMVSMGTYCDRQGDYVAVELYPASHAATRHLLSARDGRVGYLVDRSSAYPEEVRYRAYTDAMIAAGRAPEYLVAGDNSRAVTRQYVKEYVGARGCPDGLFCHNDLMAIGAYRALLDLGLRVPEDVRLIGCDGIEEVEYLECPLSTIAQPVEAFCEAACRFLHARIEDPSAPPQQQVIEAQLALRASSAPG